MSAQTRIWRGTSNAIDTTLAIGAAIAQHAHAGDLVALSGELGSGKTVFVRGMATALGVAKRDVTSPTFVLVHEYESSGPDKQAPLLVHIDAYRLNSLADLESIGWDSPTPQMRQDAVVVIEWAKRIEGDLGDDRLDVLLEHVTEQARSITVTPRGTWIDRFDDLTSALDLAVAQEKDKAAARCPICGKSVARKAKIYPFCSKRCKTVDLGRWIDGSYVISRSIEQSDLEESE